MRSEVIVNRTWNKDLILKKTRMLRYILLLTSTCLVFCNAADHAVEETLPDSTIIIPEDGVHADMLDTGVNMNKRVLMLPMHDMKLSLPAGWINKQFSHGTKSAYNFYPENRDVVKHVPLNVHAPATASFVSVWPGGYGTEFPPGTSRTLKEAPQKPKLSFKADPNSSVVFYLENGSPWGYFIVPLPQPSSWHNGFIFAQIGVEDFKITCYDGKTGKAKSPEACDEMAGDKIIRQGNILPLDSAAIMRILASIGFARESL